MALRLNDKKEVVSQVAQTLQKANSVLVVSATGVPVVEMTQLRADARQTSVQLRVIPNTLVRRALMGTPYAPLSEYCIGPSLVAFTLDHPGAAARLWLNFAKKHPQVELKAAVFEGQLLRGRAVERLATLPTYNEAISQLLALLKELVGGKLARVLLALNVKKTGGSIL